MHRLCFTLVYAVLTLATQPVGLVQAADQPTSIFNGKSSSGWQGDFKYWRVENGAIVGEIPRGQSLNKNTWLVWQDGEVADFELNLQFKLTGLPAANSGIQFRCQVDNVDHVSGYQADLDMGATWLGRIYDEHGRALLVERGSRVLIQPDGQRRTETFAPANQYAVLFREKDWNDYRIVSLGDRTAIFVNGTLFSELVDQQKGERDVRGKLAFQLHSGPETRIEFRDIRLEHLRADDKRLGDFAIKDQPTTPAQEPGTLPIGLDGKVVQSGFESGSLDGWIATGDAFRNQPVNRDGIAQRWSDQTSNKEGEYFIGGFEIVQDAGTGTLTSPPFQVTQPYASLLIGGGEAASTRVELVQIAKDGSAEAVLFTASGNNREQMRRVGIDLRAHQGKTIAVKLVDENPGGWGHLNFDDFRFHQEAPIAIEIAGGWRTTNNPVLQHLLPNQAPESKSELADRTLEQMFVPAGFSVDLVSAEPDIHQPMAFTFDARGRLWVVEGYCYPQKRPQGQGIDRILIFTDADGDGSFESRKVFAEGLNLVSGLEVGHGGVWVGAAPELLFIPDRDGDDQPDAEPIVMLDGFGYADTHETLNSFMWGPDGWLYGNQGVFNSSLIGKPGSTDEARSYLAAGIWRFHPVRHTFEVFAHGGSNPWGLDYDDMGQIFMTHCRSFWGKGSTTHVIQGGHFWNQVNSGYAPFVSAEAPANLPAMKNFLLASARYDHGTGGAGKPGTDEVYGGHSHVGTLMYLGDNWPDEYRNHLLTHNLHGHQINHQVNVREGGGYHTKHAGKDVLFCADRQYIGVDLQYGPDGAVYINDWYDPRHCHNPDVEQWDRGNGRIYRMKFDATWKPAKVDYTRASDDELVEAQLHRNDWHVRVSRLVLSERSQQRNIAPSAIERLRSMALTNPDVSRQLRAIWTLHAIGQLNEELSQKLLDDRNEYVRSWAIQLACEPSEVPNDLVNKLTQLAKKDESVFVLRYLASAVQRLSTVQAWPLIAELSKRSDAGQDREFPSLLWFGMAKQTTSDLARSIEIAEHTAIPALRDNIQWYLAKSSSEGRDKLVADLAQAKGDEQFRLLSLLELAIRNQRGLAVPKAWSSISQKLYDSTDSKVKSSAESIGAAFGDRQLYDRMRKQLESGTASLEIKRRCIQLLSGDPSPQNLKLFLKQLDAPELVSQIVPLLSKYNDSSVAESLLSKLQSLKPAENSMAMEVLCSRVDWASKVLDKIAAKELPANQLSAFYARQMASLGDSQLNERLEKEWGKLGQTSGELLAEIKELAASYKAAPLWAYSAESGAQHFKKLCAQCHTANQQNEAIAPKLGGSGAKGIDYLVENVINPNAVIGLDYQAKIILTTDDRVITGVVESQNEGAITIRTLNGSETVARSDIEEIRTSTNSFMPEGLLKTLNDRERIELFKYLMAL